MHSLNSEDFGKRNEFLLKAEFLVFFVFATAERFLKGGRRYAGSPCLLI